MVTATAAFGLLAFGAQAAWAEGFEGPSYKNPASGTQSAFGNPTGTKPESKLWWHDGLWWAVMWDIASGDYHIFWLDENTQEWNDTGTTVDGRRTSRADVLRDGNTLYVASHRIQGASESVAERSILFRYTYSTATRKYTLAATGTINNVRSETLVIAKDSTNRLWATWTQGAAAGPRTVMVAHSGNNGATWSNPIARGNVPTDDISSIIAFGGNKIGVMWNDGEFTFAVHNDGAPATSWTTEIARPGEADDHINLKADSAGRVYAAVKTGQTSAAHLRLLVRDTGGSWSDHELSAAQGLSRPIVLLHGANVRAFANGPGQNSGTIFEKSMSLADLLASPTSAFPVAMTPFIQKGGGGNPGMVDATSTKQNLTSVTGLFVLASNEDSTKTYWHNGEFGTAPPPLPPPPDTGPNVIRGTRGNDRLVGTRGRDIIIGGGGNDRIIGRGGNDRLVGGRGNDRIVGGRGRDRMLGNRGRDTLIAKDRRVDAVIGGSGFDRAHRDRRDRVRSVERIF